MQKLNDIAIHVPSEFFEDFEKIVSIGIQRANISKEARVNLKSWWDVERAIIVDSLPPIK